MQVAPRAAETDVGVNGAGKDVPAVDFDELTDLIRCVRRDVWEFSTCVPPPGLAANFRHARAGASPVSSSPRLVVSSSRRLVVSSSRRLVVSSSRRLVLSSSRPLVVSSSRRLPSVSLCSSLMFDVRTLTADALVGMMYDVGW